MEGAGRTRESPDPLFFRDNTAMLFGDAKERIEDLLRALPATSANHPAAPAEV